MTSRPKTPVEATRKRHRHQTKLACLALYGSCCARCGFDDPRALQIDHIDGSREGVGHKHRSGAGLYYALLAGRLPREAHQVLCANCNWIKRIELGEHRGYKAVRHG